MLSDEPYHWVNVIGITEGYFNVLDYLVILTYFYVKNCETHKVECAYLYKKALNIY